MRVTCIGTMCGAQRKNKNQMDRETAGRLLGASVQICVRRRAGDPGADDTAAGTVS